MVYCAAFDYNSNSSKNRVTSKFQADEAQPALLAS